MILQITHIVEYQENQQYLGGEDLLFLGVGPHLEKIDPNGYKFQIYILNLCNVRNLELKQ